MSEVKKKGRPRKAEALRLTHNVSVALPPDIYHALRAKADSLKMPATWVVREILRRALLEAGHE